ncbi:MAG TPA: hypothetical protein VGE72_21315 [Azospirillum sp.]
MSKKQVRIGQVYQTVGSSSNRAWRVRETLNLFNIPHARVSSTEDEGDVKTLSCLVLTDPTHYRLIESPAAAA